MHALARPKAVATGPSPAVPAIPAAEVPDPDRPSPSRPSDPTCSRSRRVRPSHSRFGPPRTRIMATSHTRSPSLWDDATGPEIMPDQRPVQQQGGAAQCREGEPPAEANTPPGSAGGSPSRQAVSASPLSSNPQGGSPDPLREHLVDRL